jgi:hypothetical protein
MRHGLDYPCCIHDHIHPCIEEEEEEATFARYTTSHMKTKHEEKKAQKIAEFFFIVQLITLQIIIKS